MPDPQPDCLKVGNIALHRLRVCDAGDPADEPVDLRWQRTIPCQVAQTEAPSRGKNPDYFRRGSLFARKRAVGALADHRIKRFVIQSAQLLCVTLKKLDPLG